MRWRSAALAAGLALLLAAAPGAASPSSGQIAYAELDGGTWRLMVMRSDGSQPRVLHPRHSTDAAWSPDGTRLAYNGQPLLGGVEYQLFVSGADGSRPRRLTYDRGSSRSPSWSPDGRSIVYSLVLPVEDGTFTCELRIVDVATREVRTLVTVGALSFVAPVALPCASFPSWSPSGDDIVFNALPGPDSAQGLDEAGPLMLVRPDGTGLRAFPDDVVGFAPEWSPDGGRIVFSAPVDGAGSRWAAQTVRADGTDRRVLTPPTHDAYFTTWSPDGKQIAFQSAAIDAGHDQLFRVSSAGGGSPVRLTGGSLDRAVPAWGPPPRGRPGTR